jgi:hypothetical protein
MLLPYSKQMEPADWNVSHASTCAATDSSERFVYVSGSERRISFASSNEMPAGT